MTPGSAEPASRRRAELAWLESHVNYERSPSGGRPKAPTLDRIRAAVEALGDPQASAQAIHVTGTNGKGTTARLASGLLAAAGLVVGTYTSPHLVRLNERIARNLEPITDDDLDLALSEVRAIESLIDGTLTHFEVLTAAAYAWFADVATDANVIEVGLGGRWDPTNVVDAPVAVVTNVSLDHTDVMGATRELIAAEKAGIVKPGATAVLGQADEVVVRAVEAQEPSEIWRMGDEFEVLADQRALGGHEIAFRTPGATYTEVLLPLHGAHQVANAVVAVTAVEAFLGRPLPDDLVVDTLAMATSPGRFEVIGRRPLVILDGAHNPAGAEAASQTLAEEFTFDGRLILVVGLLVGRDPVVMLEALGAEDAIVVACTPDSPRAVPAGEVAEAARTVGAEDVQLVDDPVGALRLAMRMAAEDDCVLVAGSLYVVGAVRGALKPG